MLGPKLNMGVIQIRSLLAARFALYYLQHCDGHNNHNIVGGSGLSAGGLSFLPPGGAVAIKQRYPEIR